MLTVSLVIRLRVVLPSEISDVALRLLHRLKCPTERITTDSTVQSEADRVAGVATAG